MATVYIDPDVGDGGTGAIDDPYNEWSDVTLAQDLTIMVKGGTTLEHPTDRFILNTYSGMTLTSYGTGKATLSINQTSGYQENTLQSNAADFTLENIIITEPRDGGTYGYCMQITGTNAIIKDVTIRGPATARNQWSAGIRVSGWPFTITGCDIDGYTMAIFPYSPTVTSDVSIIANNKCQCNVHASQTGNGDALTIGGSPTVTDYLYNLHIYGNEFTNFSENGIDLSWGDHILIYNNEIHTDTGQLSNPFGILVGNTGTSVGHKIYRNYIHDISGTGGALATRGASKLEIYSNLVHDTYSGFYNHYAGSDDNVYYNNTLVNTYGGITATDSTTGIKVYNNIIYGTTNAITEDTGSDITYGNNCTYPGAVNGSPTDDGGNITVDPLLDSTYSLTAESPCINAGVKPLSNIDYEGKYRKGPGYDIGAVWYDSHEDSTKPKKRMASGGSK